MHQVFVFGTLKKGFPNYASNKGSLVKGDFETKHRYPLFLVGDRFSPWLVLNLDQGHKIKGQVFTLSDAEMHEMDTLERISERDGYHRMEIAVISELTGEELTVFAYVKSMEQLSTADIRQELTGEYLIDHALLYSSRSKITA